MLSALYCLEPGTYAVKRKNGGTGSRHGRYRARLHNSYSLSIGADPLLYGTELDGHLSQLRQQLEVVRGGHFGHLGWRLGVPLDHSFGRFFQVLLVAGWLVDVDEADRR